MSSLDDRPTLPPTPVFNAEMASYLTDAAARTNPQRPARKTGKYVTVGIAAIAVVSGITIATTHAPKTSRPHSADVSLGAVHVHLAAFSVDTQLGGTVTVTLSTHQVLDPHLMRQALAQAGIPAVINVGTVCIDPHPDRAALFEFVSPNLSRAVGTWAVKITPSKMPAGSTLSLGYFPGGVRVTLLSAGVSDTCTSNPPPVQGN
jgi:hypothetical protein